MERKLIVRLHNETGSLPEPPQPGFVYRIPSRSVVQFQLHVGSPLNTESTRLVLEEPEMSVAGSHSACGHWFAELTFENPGSSCVWVTSGTQTGVRNYIVVDPDLPMAGLCAQTVLSRSLGTVDRWEAVLSEQAELGYNLFHITPIQILGDSNSLYSISDPTQLSPELFPASTSAERVEKLRSVVNSLRDKYGAICAIDIVLNHCATSSEFVEEHPEIGYNLHNSPHQRVAFELDSAIAKFSEDIARNAVNSFDRRNKIENERDLGKILHIFRHEVLEPLKLNEFFVINIEKVMKEYPSEEAKDTAGAGSLSEEQKIQLAQKGREEFVLKYVLTHEGEERLGTSVDYSLLQQVCGKNETKSVLEKVNSLIMGRYDRHIADILRNLEGDIRYYKLELRQSQITADNPLVRPYFKVCRSGEVVLFNGFIMGYTTVLKDFAEKEGWHYFRRNIVVWSDCVKLRYGASKEDCPVLWERMEEYVGGMARVFDSFRLDNTHSTPIHVCEYYLKLARSINPQILVFAELFTNDATTDALFVSRLGLNMLIREAMQAHSPKNLGEMVYYYGNGDLQSLGALDSTDLNNTSLLALTPEMTQFRLQASLVPALFYDCTHDNETPNQKRTAIDALPNAAMVAMANCALASTRGYDELLPLQLSVVTERRLYQTSASDSHRSIPTVNVAGDGSVKFTLQISAHAREISVRGSWNGWSEGVDLQHIDGLWVVALGFGKDQQGVKHQYKYIIDGNWTVDQAAPTIHEGGNVNNLLEVREKGFSPSGSARNMYGVRRVLNTLHSRMAAENFSTIYVHQWADDLTMVIRQCPDNLDSYVMVARSAHHHSSDNKSLPDVQLPGVIQSFELISTLSVNHGSFRDNPQFVNGLDGSAVIHANPNEFCSVRRTGTVDTVDFSRIPQGLVVIIRTQVQNTNDVKRLTAMYEELCDFQRCQYVFNELNLEHINHLLWRCDREERDISGNQDGAYGVPGYRAFNYAGIGSLVIEFLPLSLSNNLGHQIFNNIREGDWLIDYTQRRLKDLPSSFKNYIAPAFDIIRGLPVGVKPHHVSKLVLLVFRGVKMHLSRTLFTINTDDSLTESLILCTTQFWGKINSATAPYSNMTLSAGLPHFSAEYMRAWGRDTFIALRGLFLCTGRFSEAKDIIKSFAAVLRHGLIPNLMDSGNNPRYNARDATWFFLQSIKDCVQMDGPDILSQEVRLKFYERQLPISEVVQMIMQAHAEGIHFREQNAGTKIDAHMQDKGFNIDIELDPSTGVISGGNKLNCGTWMDKMGSSAKAGNKGVPATPRDGAPIELTGLLYSVLEFLIEMNSKGLYPHTGVQLKNGSKFEWTEWASNLKQNFENLYFNGPAYKDTVGSDDASDRMIRPNMCIAMTVAPGLFNKENVQRALLCAKEKLMPLIGKGQIGIRTLNEEDSKYRPIYDNSNDSGDFSTAHGFCYHNGPEWVWPVGYYFRAMDLFHVQPRHEILASMDTYREFLEQSDWMSIPELTNAKGEVCHHSCPAQAWSISCLIDVLYDLSSR